MDRNCNKKPSKISTKSMLEKGMQQNINSCPTWSQNGSQNQEQINQTRGPKFDARKGRDGATAREGRRVGRDATSNVLNISKRLVLVF